MLLPFWTSVLVRTTAWIALLQTNGVVNSVLIWSGLVGQPLEMLYTELATVLIMTHILLPFMILPLYATMKGIDPSYMKAAMSLGSRPVPAFIRVYLPMTLPGLSAGALLVFIISIGFFIIPALVGGTEGQMISNLIAFHMQQSNNWELAAALGTLLLVLVLVLYWIYDRLVGSTRCGWAEENGYDRAPLFQPLAPAGGLRDPPCAAAVLVFLLLPVVIVIPLSFNAEPFFTFTEGMLTLQPDAYSLRWYEGILADPNWMLAIKNSFIIAIFATIVATTLGTIAAVGLASGDLPFRRFITALLLSPMIVPLIIVAAGIFFFFSRFGLIATYPGVIIAHAALGVPFVVITVSATLAGFDRSIYNAGLGLGAGPLRTFADVVFPLIRPGVIPGAVFAFVTSFDEVVLILFPRRPRPADHPAPDVLRASRADQSDDPRGRDAARLLSIALLATLELSAAVAPPLPGARRRTGPGNLAPPRRFEMRAEAVALHQRLAAGEAVAA